MTKAPSNTKYLNLVGTVRWAKVYTPDEFRGAVRWSIDFYPESDEVIKQIKEAGIQKTLKDKGEGKYLNFTRSTTKFMKDRLVYFTPPIIYDADGDMMVYYTDDNEDKVIRSYEDKDFNVKRVGEPVLIGNGSKVEITLSVYPTAMGPGNRLESIKILDLVTYERPPEAEESKEVVGPEVVATKKMENATPPW